MRGSSRLCLILLAARAAVGPGLVLECTRLVACAPQALKAEWLEFTWRHGGGLPLPRPIMLDAAGTSRLLAPPFLKEAILSDVEGDGSSTITYAVQDPSTFSVYPVSSHLGTVDFREAAGGRTELRWRVEWTAHEFWAGWTTLVTRVIVEVLADNLKDRVEAPLQRQDRLEQAIFRAVLDKVKDSAFVRERHADHVARPTPAHMLQGSWFAGAPESFKLNFANSAFGGFLERLMAEEADYLGDWKIAKIVDAAGGAENSFDAAAAAADLDAVIAAADIVVFSFHDCPWCIQAKQALAGYNHDGRESVSVVEIDELAGGRGKVLRAAIAARTGRTSMPAIFVRGRPIGGYSDGAPVGPGLAAWLAEQVVPSPSMSKSN